MSNCYCLEFSFAKVSEYDLTYTNCSGDTVTETFLSGTTYNICSQDLDPITSCLDIAFEVKGLCIDGDCPQQLIKYQNECDVITIFPMGVQCYVTHPTNSIKYDGSATLQITGGTPPYQVMWDNGNISTTISNLGPGSYGSTVVDFYGDFTANTICVLTGATPTPTLTPTPTPTPLPTFGDLCLVIKGKVGKIPILQTYTFNYNGYVNGKPSWISDDTLYTIEWSLVDSQWEIIGLPNGWVMVNLNPAIPPVTGWQILGVVLPYSITEVTVSEGDCDSLDILRYELTVNQPTCECNGSIIFNVIDGVPPYQYSVNGIQYTNSPIFNNLCSGYYPTVVTDSSGQTFNYPINLSPAPPPQVYVFNMVVNYSLGTFSVTSSPSLPAGVSAIVDILHTSTFSVAPSPSSANYNNIVTLNVDSVPVPFTTQTTTTTSVLVPACDGASNTTTTKGYLWDNLIMNSGTVINGTISNLVTPVPPSPAIPCYSVAYGYSLIIKSARLLNCPCCLTSIKNPPSYSTGKVTVV
jgi:hypothetical protein